ncbi:MAG TPA: gamma carbonic anhydrase family protein [Chloroflexota bacterium]|jgi:phenylacetic acid degradation protein|nr:gamma carbonic anhydrase family protein [Chloroflexota bacterium]
MALYEFEGRRPTIGRTSFVHPAATIIGGVTIGEHCYIGAGAVLRADWEDIWVGDGSNIQENAVVHIRAPMAGQPGVPTRLGENSHIAHGAIIHAATLGRHVLVGMGAIVQDRCVLGDDAIVAPGAVLREGTEVPPRAIVVGVPARIVREVTEAERAYWLEATRRYQELAARSLAGLRRLDG